MMIETSLPVGRESVLSISRSNQEPEWLAAKRLHAFDMAGQLELPKLEKTRIDRWNLNSYGEYKPLDTMNHIEDLPEHVQSIIQSFDSNHMLVQVDSGVVYMKMSDSLRDQGVIFTDLGTACREYAHLVEPYLGNIVRDDENRLTALHNALWNGGVFLYVPRNVVLKETILGLFVSDNGEASFMPHILIVAEANSAVTFVDQVASTAGTQELVHHAAVEIVAKSGAHVRYASVHQLRESMVDISYRRSIADNDARVEWILGELNDGNTMSNTISTLKGNGSTTDGKVICIGSLNQKLSLTTTADHRGRNTRSDMITRAVMRDEATAIVNGITKIEKGATYSNGEQLQRILMLSPKARGDANPVLLIDEDEVLAGHAASVGQVNPDDIYYLMSRGISKADAKRLIIRGFLTPTIAEIPLEKLKNKLLDFLERKLER